MASTAFPAVAHTSGTWATTGSMTTARVYHTATVLQHGQILVAGGGQAGSDLPSAASAELYDPAAGQ